MVKAVYLPCIIVAFYHALYHQWLASSDVLRENVTLSTITQYHHEFA